MQSHVSVGQRLVTKNHVVDAQSLSLGGGSTASISLPISIPATKHLANYNLVSGSFVHSSESKRDGAYSQPGSFTDVSMSLDQECKYASPKNTDEKKSESMSVTTYYGKSQYWYDMNFAYAEQAIESGNLNWLKFLLGPDVTKHRLHYEQEMRNSQFLWLKTEHQLAFFKKAHELIEECLRVQETIRINESILIEFKDHLEFFTNSIAHNLLNTRNKKPPELSKLYEERKALYDEVKRMSPKNNSKQKFAEQGSQLTGLKAKLAEIESKYFYQYLEVEKNTLCDVTQAFSEKNRLKVADPITGLCEGELERIKEEYIPYLKALACHERAKKEEYEDESSSQYIQKMKEVEGNFTYFKRVLKNFRKRSSYVLESEDQARSLVARINRELENEVQTLKSKYMTSMSENVETLQKTRSAHITLSKAKDSFEYPLVNQHEYFLTGVIKEFSTLPEINEFYLHRNIQKFSARLALGKKCKNSYDNKTEHDNKKLILLKDYQKKCNVTIESFKRQSYVWMITDDKLPKCYRKKTKAEKEAIIKDILESDIHYFPITEMRTKDDLTLFHLAMRQYAFACYHAGLKNASLKEKSMPAVYLEMSEVLRQHQGSPFPRSINPNAGGAKQTAYEFGNCFIPHEARSRLQLPDWSSTILDLKYIPTYTPGGKKIKDILLKYAMKTENELSGFFARLFNWALTYSWHLKAIRRRDDVGVMTAELYEAHIGLTEVSLIMIIRKLIINSETDKSERGFLGKSSLYDELKLALQEIDSKKIISLNMNEVDYFEIQRKAFEITCAEQKQKDNEWKEQVVKSTESSTQVIKNQNCALEEKVMDLTKLLNAMQKQHEIEREKDKENTIRLIHELMNKKNEAPGQSSTVSPTQNASNVSLSERHGLFPAASSRSVNDQSIENSSQEIAKMVLNEIIDKVVGENERTYGIAM